MPPFQKCCGNAFADPPDSVAPDGPEWLNKPRKSTDCLFLIFFLAFWLGMVVIAGVAFSTGEPERLLYGTDWQGYTCGAENDGGDSDMTDKELIYYPRLADDVQDFLTLCGTGCTVSDLYNAPFLGVCVDECPQMGDAAFEVDGDTYEVLLNSESVFFRCLQYNEVDSNYTIQCVAPDEADHTVYDCASERACDLIIEDLDGVECTLSELTEVTQTTKPAETDPIYDALQEAAATVARWIGDVETTQAEIFVSGIVIAAVCAYAYIMALRRWARCMVWFTIALVVAILLGITLYLCDKGGLLDKYIYEVPESESTPATQADADKQDYYSYAAYLFIVIDTIVLLLLIFLRTRIQLATGIIMEASNAIAAMPLVVFFPLITILMTVGLVLFWVYAAFHIYTMGDTSIADLTDYAASQAGVDESAYQGALDYFNSTEVYDRDDVSDFLMIYHLFGLLWTNQVINALLMATIAGGICSWYWSADKEKRTDSGAPVWDAFKRTVRFHMGSLCLGGLIIAIVQMCRLALEYIDQKTKELQRDNPIVKIIMCCLRIYLWCFEKCVKFISYNAYIIVAMKGKSFCPAVKESFSLILDNVSRVATVNVISNFLLLLGKSAIIAFSTLMCLKMIENNDEIDSIIFPLLVTMILSYGIASGAFTVVGMAIDTILMCFCVDCRENAESGNFFMSDSLLMYVNSAKKHSMYKAVEDHGEGATPSAAI